METNEPMPRLLQSQARGVLRALHAASRYIDASALVTGDGRVVTSLLGSRVDADRFGAMCASLLSLSVRAAQELERGEPHQIVLDCAAGPVLLTRAGAGGVLALAAVPEANLGALIHAARSAARSLGELMSGAGDT